MKKSTEKTKSLKKEALLCLGFAMLLLLVSGVKITQAAWQEPSAPPPGGNIPAPISVGNETQAKEGNLKLDPNYNPDIPTGSVPNPLEVIGTGKIIEAVADDLEVAETLYVDQTNHKIGIGTDVPSAKLSVVNGRVMVGTDTAPVSGQAVYGTSSVDYGISGTTLAEAKAGVYGLGVDSTGYGVYGQSDNNYGVFGQGLLGGYGIYGLTNSLNNAAVYGENTSLGWAGYFDGRLGAGSDVVSNRFLPTKLQSSLIPFTSGYAILDRQISDQVGTPLRLSAAFDGTYLWSSTKIGYDENGDGFFGDGNNLFQTRASDGEVIGEYRLNSPDFTGGVATPYDLAFDGQYIWATSTGTGDNTLVRFDPKTGQQAHCSTGDGSNPQNLTVSTIAGEVFIWTANFGGADVTKFDRNCNQIGVYPLGNGGLGNKYYNGTKVEPTDILFAEDYLWVAARIGDLTVQDQIIKVNPGTGAVETRYFINSAISVPNFIYDGRHFWVIAATDTSPAKKVVKIRATDGVEEADIGLPRDPQGLVFDGTFIWVASDGSTFPYTGTLSRITVANNEITNFNNVLSTGYYPRQDKMIFDGIYLWLLTSCKQDYSQCGEESSNILRWMKLYAGTGLGHTDLNTVVNLQTQTGQCENPSNPDSSSNLQCVFNWHCPAGTGNPAPLEGIAVGTNQSGTAYDTAIDATYMYTVGSSSGGGIYDWYLEKRSLADSSLDTSFGSEGVIRGPSESYSARAIAIDYTYMYVVGADEDPSFRIEKRSLSDGSLDFSFGTNGVALGTSNSVTAMDIAIDSNYMYVVGGTEQNRIRIEKRRLSDGAWCTAANCGTNFGGGGSDPYGVLTGASGSGNLTAIAIDSTFMYVIGGDSSGDWRIEKRYLTDGSYDTTFGLSGIVTGASESNVANDIAIDSTYMYIAGADHSLDWRIEKRYLSNGSYDTTFGVSGVVTGETVSYTANALSIDSTYMYVVGRTNTSNVNLRLEKLLLSNGSVDPSFGTNGVIVGDSGVALGVAIDSTYMYVVGSSNFRTEKRSLSNGALDTNFGPGELDVYGVITGASESKEAYDIAIDSDYMYVVGRDEASNWRIEKRYLSDGSYDTSFGVSGVVTSTDGFFIRGIAIDSTYMYVVGSTDSPYDWRIEKRYLSNGSYDTSFGTGGAVTGASESYVAYDIAIDSDYMYVVGRTDGGDWYIAKLYLSNGSYDTSFGTGGVITGPSESFIADGIAIDSTYMYVIGYTDPSAGDDMRIAKLYLSNGSYDTSFGTGGVITGPSESTEVYDIAIDSIYMYVVGRGNPWRIEKRSLSNGTPDDGFGTSGVVYGSGYHADGIAIDSTYMYVVGSVDFSAIWDIEKRLLTNGSLATGFGGVRLDPEGVISGDITTRRAYSIAIDATYMYVGGSDQTSDWRIEKRGLTTGSLDGDNFGDYTYGGDEVCNANNATQSGNINISNSAELFNNHCYSPGLDKHYFDSPCTTDTDCSGSQQCVGGDVQIGDDIDAPGNQWAGSDETVLVSGGTAACLTNGYFIKGITLGADSKVSGIVCRGL